MKISVPKLQTLPTLPMNEEKKSGKMGILPYFGNLPTLPAHFLAHIEPLLGK